MKNAKYLGNWWRDIYEIFRVFGDIPRVSYAKYGGDLPTQFLWKRWES